MRSIRVAACTPGARSSNPATVRLHSGLITSSVLTCVVGLARAEPGPVQETIVIIDDAPARPSQDEAASASVITIDRPARSAETMPDLLDDVPGVTVSRLGGVGAPALLSLRGSSWDQVSVYLDGVNLNLAAGGGVDVSTLPVGDLARVEIYRGATPIAYGISAIGGVVAVETRRPERDGATVEAGAGSFGTWLGGGSVTLAGARSGIYVGLHALASAGDFDFLDTKGTAFDPADDEVLPRHNNRSRELDGLVRGFVRLRGERELSVLALGFTRTQGLPGYPRYATEQVGLRTQRAIASVGYRGLDELGVNSQLRVQLYGYGLEQRFVDPQAEIALTPTEARDRTFALGTTVRASRVVSWWLQPAALLDLRRESFAPVELTTGERGVESTRLVGVAGVEAPLRRPALGLAVIPSVRVELARDVSAGRDGRGVLVEADTPMTSARPTLRLAATQAVGADVQLRSNLGRYTRLPSFLELYGNTGFILGNRELVPEQGLTADLGAAYDGAVGPLAIVADGAVFASVVDELIAFQQNAYGVARARNIGRARVLGVESSVELRYRSARLYGQATFTDARDRSDSAAAHDRQLPYRPRTHVTVRPELRRVALGGLELGGFVEVDLSSGNYVDPANLVRLPSRVLVAAGLSVATANRRLRVTTTATNLTNASVNDVLSYPLPGRAFFVTVSLAATPSPQGN